MKNITGIFSLFILTATSINNVTGQEANYAQNIVKFLNLDGNKLVIKYDLPSSDSTQLFDIILKIYYDDQVIQPKDSNLHGTYGNKVNPGIEKVILWDFPNEFKGDINKVTIEVVAKPMSGPLANFEYKILNTEAPFEVKFENKSKNADLYTWKFGDLKYPQNNLSTLESPVHEYKAGGIYKVELIAGSSKSSETNSIIKEIALGSKNNQDVLKHKKLRNIWLGGALASAGIGGYCFLKYSSNYNDWKEQGTDELEKKYKNNRTIGTVAAIVSGVCITEVIIQSKKLKTAKQNMSMSFIPLDKGGAVELVWNF